MKIKVNEEEKRIISKYLEDYLNIKKYEESLLLNYSNIIKPNENGSYLSIINDYYIEETDYSVLKESISDYVLKNIKEMLYVSDNKNAKYQVYINKHNTSKENYVQNGSLVLILNKVAFSKTNLGDFLIQTEDLKNYITQLEMEIGNLINVPVKILFKEVL